MGHSLRGGKQNDVIWMQSIEMEVHRTRPKEWEAPLVQSGMGS